MSGRPGKFLDFCPPLWDNTNMILDSHTHIFPPELIARREQLLASEPWFGCLYANPKAKMATAEQLITAMDAAGVDCALTFGFGWRDPGLCRVSNDYVCEAVRTYPGRLMGSAVVNPAVPGAEAEVARAASTGAFHGIGELMPDGQQCTLDDVDLLAPVMEAAQALSWPVLTHASEPVGHDYPGKGCPSLASAVHLAERFPQTTIVLAHWGGGLFFYELMPEVRRALARVYYDTAASPLLYDDAIFNVAVLMASHKILFGTDYPLLGPKRLLERVRGTGIADRELGKLVGGNAAQVFGLSSCP